MKKHLRLIIFLFLICILLISLSRARFIIANFSWRVVKPFSAAASQAGFGTNRLFSALTEIRSLRQQNKALSNKMAQMEVDKSRITELEYENEMLKKEIGFAGENKSAELIPAKIIGREPTTFLDYIIINQGKNAELRPGMAVMANGALVGQLTDVYDNSAKVVLITSKDSIVQAMLQVSRSKGILRGGISGLVLENISQDTEISPNEYVVTSGLGGKMEQGILIGKTDRNRSSSEIFKNVLVEPIADLSSLELVFVAKSLKLKL